ncbi:MAG: hypothetical protein FWG63_04630 [Defluviitaleaceae bacterium]|nr:hypothetical protein [Defluviitaleaceae bacterium]
MKKDQVYSLFKNFFASVAAGALFSILWHWINTSELFHTLLDETAETEWLPVAIIVGIIAAVVAFGWFLYEKKPTGGSFFASLKNALTPSRSHSYSPAKWITAGNWLEGGAIFFLLLYFVLYLIATFSGFWDIVVAIIGFVLIYIGHIAVVANIDEVRNPLGKIILVAIVVAWAAFGMVFLPIWDDYTSQVIATQQLPMDVVQMYAQDNTLNFRFISEVLPAIYEIVLAGDERNSIFALAAHMVLGILAAAVMFASGLRSLVARVVVLAVALAVIGFGFGLITGWFAESDINIAWSGSATQQSFAANMQNINYGFTYISTGTNVTMAVDYTGVLWGWGRNYDNLLLGADNPIENPAPVQIMENIATVSVGSSHAMAIDTNGTLWGWGSNRFGALGDGTNTHRDTPVQIMQNVTKVYVQSSTTMAIDAYGTLWGWGWNHAGQIGDNEIETHLNPVPIMENIVSVAIGNWFVMAIDGYGTLWGWGGNTHGEMGQGTLGVLSTPTPPTPIMNNIVAVSVGGWHTMAIDSNGTLWGWGNNIGSILGDGTNFFGTSNPVSSPIVIRENIVAVSASSPYTMAIDTNGTLWGWGNNQFGRLGDGTTAHRSAPVQIRENIAAIHTGGLHTMAVDNNGVLWAWGRNQYGQLGDGTIIDRHTPVPIM